MENLITENSHSPSIDVENCQDAKSCDSVENFQKFMYDLFEKNGVINDLRAYLRGHIVGVLRSAQTGEPPKCQQHFTQRLELPLQALNMLIAEYLLRLEFNYSLSVFISEIPLANMVFDFAKTLMLNCSFDAPLRFKDEDVWCILNYLGVRCDSTSAYNIVKMYRDDGQKPLLLCLIRNMALHKDEQADSVRESFSSGNSTESMAAKEPHQAPSVDFFKCKHYTCCKKCQSKVSSIKEKFNKQKKVFTQNIKESRIKNVEFLLKNIDVFEKSIIDEMFHQLKSVYESEMEMMKNDEQKREKRSAAAYAAQLQQKRTEMEQTFKAREEELVKNVQAKKRFLWGLARDLREQHQHLARAMQGVRDEASRLSAKEDSLKTQLAKAEGIIRQRGEDMRQQITNELSTLEDHLDCMKKERDSINKERSELEHIKNLCTSTIKTTNILNQNEDMCSHYDVIKKEFSVLKKYLNTAKLEPKCVTEKSTITELADVTSKIDVILNNGQDVERNNSDLKVKRVVNDLKKHKNVNFSQSNLDEIYRERSRSSRSHSSVSSEAGDAQIDVPNSLHRLRGENERLRTFARQQREHIDELSSQQARLQAELTLSRTPPAPAPAPHPRARARTPPALPDPPGYDMQRLNSSASTNNLCHGWRKGAGEELSLFADANPRIVIPGDTLPFLGRVDRQADCRRYFISQWRAMRRRSSPDRVVSPASRRRERANSAGPSVQVAEDTHGSNDDRSPTDEHYSQTARENSRKRPKTANEKSKNREKGKCTPKEAKERFRSIERGGRAASPRQKSPSSVIRDAKLRLRKLEIEAEAVERSYRDFRAQRAHYTRPTNDALLKETSTNPSPKPDETHAIQSTSQIDKPKPISDFSQYIQEYSTKCDLSETVFRNKNATSIKVKPVPAALSCAQPLHKISNHNYLETPLIEFRKYYHSEKRTEVKISDSPVTATVVDDTNENCRTPTFINVAAFDYKHPQNRAKKRNDSRNDNSPKSKIPVPMSKIESDKPSSHNRESIKILDLVKPTKTTDVDASVSPSNKNRSEAPINCEKPGSSRSPLSHRDNQSIGSPSTTNALNSDNFEGNKTNKDDSGSRTNSHNTLAHIDIENDDLPKSPTPTLGQLDGRYRPKSPKSGNVDGSNIDNNLQARLDTLRKSKHDKELEILKKNISKLYNVSEKSVDEKRYIEKLRPDAMSKMSDRRVVKDETIIEVTRDESASDSKVNPEDRNLLRIEIDSVSEINDVKIADSQTQDLLLVVESSVEGPVLSDGEFKKELMSAQMTILVSPRMSPVKAFENLQFPSDSRNLDFGDKSIKICAKEFHAIYQNEPSDSNSVHIQSDAPKGSAAHDDPDYQDDFSADVDNFNNPTYDTDIDNRSPISMLITSETETWESLI